MGPQLMVQAVVIAFVKEVEVVIGQERDVMPHRDGEVLIVVLVFLSTMGLFL